MSVKYEVELEAEFLGDISDLDPAPQSPVVAEPAGPSPEHHVSGSVVPISQEHRAQAHAHEGHPSEQSTVQFAAQATPQPALARVRQPWHALFIPCLQSITSRILAVSLLPSNLQEVIHGLATIKIVAEWSHQQKGSWW